jgi:phenylalanyl-tRNA synthetase beta chain
MIDEYPLPPEPITIDLPVKEVERLLGITLTAPEAADILSRLRFDVTLKGDSLHVIAPDYRTDIGTGVVGQADLVEEIARIIGYDAIPTTMIADMMPDQLPDPVFQAEEKIRDLLVDLGLTENISHRMSSPEAENLLVPQGMASSLPSAGYITLANPIAPEKSVMRHTLLVGLLNNALNNLRYTNRLSLFEIGSVYLKGEARLPDEPLRLGIVLCGTRRASSWLPDESNTTVDFYDLKGTIESLVKGLHLPNVTYARSTHTSFHPGRSAALIVNGKELGHFGELHPLVIQAFKLDVAVYAAEIDLQGLIAAIPARYVVKSLPTTPAVLEDVAFVVADDMPAANVEAAIRKAGGALLKEVSLFDVYRGTPIPAGQKSLAYALTYQTDEKTLTDDEVKKLRKKIIALAERECGATLRA